MKRKIEYLESVEKQDLLAWIYNFQETANFCKWSEEDSKDVLLSLLRIKINLNKKGNITSEDLLSELR